VSDVYALILLGGFLVWKGMKIGRMSDFVLWMIGTCLRISTTKINNIL
jgi:hypothetical protein